jgi:hypothetical protein
MKKIIATNPLTGRKKSLKTNRFGEVGFGIKLTKDSFNIFDPLTGEVFTVSKDKSVNNGERTSQSR